MGLDQFLSAKLYIGGCYEHNGITGTIDIKKRPVKYNHDKNEYEPTGPEEPFIQMTNLSQVEDITLRVGYWRKANAIHKWFVDQVAEGEDDCQPVHVERSQLEELKRLCEEVLSKSLLIDGKVRNGQHFANGKWEDIIIDGKIVFGAEAAMEKLPTTEGLFFGSTDYDMWYIQDLQNTVEIITKALSDPLLKDCDFEYRASW